MSALIYKQRFFHPNKPKTAVSNYCHIGYIATRPGAVRHGAKNHGLFGKLKPGELQVFDSWQEVARTARDISQQGKNMYRGIISFRKETAMELGLSNFTAWQQYMEQHIATLAAQNQIKTENLCWAAALHNEMDHPHLHVVFWDRKQEIMKNFTSPEVPNSIRKQLIKDTFAYKIKQFIAMRDQAKSGVSEITDQLVSEFENYLKQLNPRAFRAFQQRFEVDDEDSLLLFPKHPLVEPSSVKKLAEQLFQLRQQMPKSGRLAYKLLPPESKTPLDKFVQNLLQENRYLAQMVEDYVEAKMNLAMLYDSNPDHLNRQRAKYQAEAEKRIANRILSTVRTIIQLEKDASFNIKQANWQYAMTEQLVLELLNLMEGLAMNAQMDYDDKSKLMGGDLSKQAKKEWLLRNKDKGFDR
ncbi:hypothetical protein KDC22_23650 [Paenibacillus tritici]|uniref:MobP3 family relaxase n=1 Tax=Paenibacillus tritici TaxID=1873425 RepID=UPI001BA988C6|nr:MobP3 family relaxase [Paenibacillus tritici]QUL53373.1 hypothetical protein KDC22_23650 [Paenibacillus tritici]